MWLYPVSSQAYSAVARSPVKGNTKWEPIPYLLIQ